MAYPGGKAGAGVYQAIINQLPPHDTYIEPFAGGAAIASMKRPARRTVLVDRASSVVARLAGDRFEVVKACGINYLEGHDFTGRDLVYCDPPYVQAARRSSKRLYRYEFSDRAHSRLLAVLEQLPCMVALSGYDNLIYRAALPHWRCIRFPAMTRGGPAEECLWMNYPAPVALHDYRYLGKDFRERERIKRKVGRWRDRLHRLPELERAAILSALLELASRDLASPDVATSAPPDLARAAVGIPSPDAAISPAPVVRSWRAA